MVSARRLALVAFVALLVAPGFAGALVPALPRDVLGAGPLGLPTEDAVDVVATNVSRVLGENLTREDVSLALDLDFRTLDFDLVGMVFGGGTLEANARLAAKLELRAISVSRIEELLAERTQGAVNLSTLGVNASRQVIAADEFRSLLAGEALAAFEDEQESLVRAIVQDSFPDLTILSAEFEWSQTDPLVNTQGDLDRQFPRLTEPPIVLDAVVELQVLRRESLAALLLDALREEAAEEGFAPGGGGGAIEDDEAPDPREELIERLRAENEGAFYERSAFSRLGITQLLVLRMEPGWDLDMTMRLPKGYTFEYASADVAVAPDLGGARTAVYARDSGEPVPNPVAISISNRYLVTVALLATVLLAGALLRLPVLIAANLLLVRRARKLGRRGRRVPVVVAGAAERAQEVAPRQ